MSYGILLAVVLPMPLFQDPAPGDSVDALIRQLGSQRFSVREQATKRLLERPEAAPALRKAIGSDDAETAQRAAYILGELDRRPLRRAAAFIEAGAVDCAVELLARWPEGKDEAACWEVAQALGRKLFDLDAKRQGKAKEILLLSSAELPVVMTGQRFTKDVKRRGTGLFVRTTEVDVDRTLSDIFYLCESARVRSQMFSHSVLFALGPVEVEDGPHQCIIVADGDVTIRGDIGNSLIIARGKVTCGQLVMDSQVISGKSVSVKPGRARNSIITENEPNPLGFVRFFNPAQEGIAVEAHESGVKVKQADAAKPFARDGLRAGDVVASLNGKATDSPETFRRLLRRCMALEEPMTFRVVRGGKELEIRVGPVR